MVSEKQRKHMEKLNVNQKRENNRNWKGGRVKHQGYIAVRVGDKYVYEHLKWFILKKIWKQTLNGLKA